MELEDTIVQCVRGEASSYFTSLSKSIHHIFVKISPWYIHNFPSKGSTWDSCLEHWFTLLSLRNVTIQTEVQSEAPISVACPLLFHLPFFSSPLPQLFTQGHLRALSTNSLSTNCGGGILIPTEVSLRCVSLLNHRSSHFSLCLFLSHSLYSFWLHFTQFQASAASSIILVFSFFIKITLWANVILKLSSNIQSWIHLIYYFSTWVPGPKSTVREKSQNAQIWPTGQAVLLASLA